MHLVPDTETHKETKKVTVNGQEVEVEVEVPYTVQRPVMKLRLASRAILARHSKILHHPFRRNIFVHRGRYYFVRLWARQAYECAAECKYKRHPEANGKTVVICNGHSNRDYWRWRFVAKVTAAES